MPEGMLMGALKVVKEVDKDGLHIDTRHCSTSFKPRSESSLRGILSLGLGSGI